MIKYLGTYLNMPVGLDLLNFSLVQLYNTSKPYKVRRSVTTTVCKVFKQTIISTLEQQLNNNQNWQTNILKFINYARPLTAKFHQLDLFEKRQKSKFLTNRPYHTVDQFETKTSYKFCTVVSKRLYAQIESKNFQLVTLLTQNEINKSSR